MTGRVIGVILAGGRGARMGGGKPLRDLAGRPMIAHVIDRLGPQVGALVIASAGPDEALAQFGCPMVFDVEARHPGPLAGIVSAMEWTSGHEPEAEFLVSAPCDTPLLPTDLVARLRARAAPGVDVVCAKSRDQVHYPIALWQPRLLPALRARLLHDRIRRMEAVINTLAHAAVDFTDPLGDPFDNANTPDDLYRLDRVLRARIGREPGPR